MKRQYAYVQVQDFHEDPKCPDCWRGRLSLDSMNSYWVCNAGLTRCGRRYRKVNRKVISVRCNKCGNEGELRLNQDYVLSGFESEVVQ